MPNGTMIVTSVKLPRHSGCVSAITSHGIEAGLRFDHSRAILALHESGDDHDKHQEVHCVGDCRSRAEHGLAVDQ